MNLLQAFFRGAVSGLLTGVAIGFFLIGYSLAIAVLGLLLG